MDHTLVLDIRTRGRRLLRLAEDDEFEARIAMPSLERLEIEGLSNVWIDGFSEESLEPAVEGLANVESADSRAERLIVDIEGAGSADLRGITADDALVNLAGAGTVELTMNGGVLEGSIKGVGSIVYSGPIAERRVSVEGAGNVRERQ